ncbi:MAG TPA: DUF1634 domain-containing protein [Chroococcales cyanobacterium]|jgi:uncharacterized membrane protein
MKRLEAAVSDFLWRGTLLSAIAIALGMALTLTKGNTGYPPGTYPTTPVLIWRGILSLRPGAIETLGFAILLATPVGRILLVSWGYWRRKEYSLMALSCTVLGVLILSYSLGFRH